MISPAVASFLSASGHLSRISRIDIRTMILQHNMFHSKGQLGTIRRRRRTKRPVSQRHLVAPVYWKDPTDSVG